MDITKELVVSLEEFRVVPEGLSTVKACSESPVLFASEMLGVRLYAWQVVVALKFKQCLDYRVLVKKLGKENVTTSMWQINHPAVKLVNPDIEFVLNTSRQIGKTTIAAVLNAWVVVFNKYPSGIGNNTKSLIVSASDRQSRDFLKMINGMLRTGDAFMSKTYGSKVREEYFTNLKSKKEANNTQVLTFQKHDPLRHKDLLLAGALEGPMIKSYPPTPSVLGQSASLVFIDEVGKTDKITDEFLEELYPVGNEAHAIRVYTSTPWVTSGKFFEMVDPEGLYPELKQYYEVFEFSIEAIRVENPDYYDVVLRTIKREELAGRIDEVKRGYFCQFVRGDANYFDPEKVGKAFFDYPMVEKYDGDCDLGIDFGGQSSSHTVLTVSCVTEEGAIKRLFHKRYAVGSDDHDLLIGDITDLYSRFNIQRLIYDECPAAQFIVPSFRNKGWDIHPMVFSRDKVVKYSAFRDLLNRGRAWSYRDDALMTEMFAMEKKQGKSRLMIDHGKGYTDDLIDSWIISCFFFLNSNDESFDWYDLSDEEVFV